jgi:beta-galactosidase
MGVTVEDYVPLYWEKPGVKFSGALAGPDGQCGIWADVLKPETAEVLATYSSSEHSGKAAITRNSFGKGKAIYVGADLDPASLSRVLQTLAASAGVQSMMELPRGIEMTVRQGGGKRWIFLMNQKPEPQAVKLAKPGTDLLTGQARSGEIELSAYGVQVLRLS